MADDVTFTSGANSTPPANTKAATDEITIAGAHQNAHAGIAKLAVSADGDGTHIPATAADGLLVNLGANNDVTVSGTVSVTEPVSVDDNGGSLTVDGTVSISGAVDTELTTADLDTGAGTDTRAVVGLAKAASGGAVLVSDANPLPIADGGGSITVDGTVSVTEPVSVDDNAGSLTVDAPVGTPVNVQVGDGTRTATVRDTGTSDSLNVAIVDAAGAQITSFGGGTQYAEDTAHVSGDQVTMAGVVQQAADAGLSTDGDRSLLQVDGSGFLKVNIKAGAGSGGTAQADESAFTEGTTSMTPIGGVLNDTITSDPTEDQAAAVRITAKRGLHTNLRKVDGTEIGSGAGTEANALRVTLATDSTGVVSVDDNGGSLTVDGTVSVSGTVDTELPAAGALADNTANPTVPGVGIFGHLFDGTTWDRARAADALSTTPVSKAGVTATGIGPGWDYKLAAGTLGTAVNSTLEDDASGAAFFIYHVSTDTTGTYKFEVTADDTTWITMNPWAIGETGESKVLSGAASFTPIAGEVYAVATGAWRKVRVRTLTTLGAITTFHRTGVVDAIGDTFAETVVNPGVRGLVVNQLTASDLNAEVQGRLTQDAAITNVRPLLAGGRASDAIPTAMSADGDAVMGWFDRRGALKVSLVDTGGSTEHGTSGVMVEQAAPPWEVVGDGPADAAVPANPLSVGARASTAIPTAMSADGDSVYVWANRSGAPVVTAAPHVGLNSDPWNLVHEAAQYTTTQTSTVLVAGGASEKIVVTKVQIQVGGTTAGTLQLYFGTGAYVRGTNRAIFDGEFAPSATLKPGVVMDGPFIAGTNGDDLMVTTSAALNPLTISVWYYVVT